MKRLFTSGDYFIWLTGAFLGICVLMIAGMLLLITINGTSFFYPLEIRQLTYRDADGNESVALGQVYTSESIPLEVIQRRGYDEHHPDLHRYLVRVGNRELFGDDFRWVYGPEIISNTTPLDALCLERREYGHAFGFLVSLRAGPLQQYDDALDAWIAFQRWHPYVLDIQREIRRAEKHDLGSLNYQLEQQRLSVRRWEYLLERGRMSEQEYERQKEMSSAVVARLEESFRVGQKRVDSLRALIADFQIVVRVVGTEGEEQLVMPLKDVVRAYKPNRFTSITRAQVYFSKVWEFLSEEPREANSEGGIFPAIFGTVLMVLIMSVAVVPFGVLAALYLREYAKEGFLLRTIRIAVNNLAGVPSIVYGMFGLGFFVYMIGGTIDSLLYPERLPTPTYGTGGILWASLTLALLTVPVVIVATEEALAAIPFGMREGSLALGATKWDTVRRVVLPAATPGIMTGAILAMARGAGEVAPLMITGVVKLAAEMPFDANFPYFHFDRKFMHLGFHIYDVGFQTSNVEANIGIVYATTLLLILLVLVLNLTAIIIRARLRSRYRLIGF